MSAKTRFKILLPLLVLFALGLILWGVFKLVSPSDMTGYFHRYNPEYSGYPHQPTEDIFNYAFIGMGVVVLLLTPLLIWRGRQLIRKEEKQAAKQDEMDEMLEDYRRRKQRP